MPPGRKTRRTSASVAIRSRSRSSDCRSPYGASTIENPLSNGRNLMSPRISRTLPVSRARLTRVRARVSIGLERSMPTSGDASPPERQRDAACAATELQDRATTVQRQIPPEGHVALAERPRIFPVIERRVVVPALVSVIHGIQNAKGKHCHTWRSGIGMSVALRLRLLAFRTLHFALQSSNRFSVRRSQRASCSGSRRTTSLPDWPRPRRP